MKNYRKERDINNAFEFSNLGIGQYKSGKDGLWPRYESGRFTFYTEDGSEESGHKLGAWSYGWGQFVAMSTDGKTIYFNDNSYSMQTSQHQEMARRILALMDAEGNGFTVKTVYVRSGLQNIQGEIRNVAYEMAENEHALEERSVRDRKYYSERIKWGQAKIQELLKLAKDLGQRAVAPTAKEQADNYVQAKKSHEVNREYARRRAQEKRERELKARAAETVARFASAGIDLVADTQDLADAIKNSNVIQLKRGQS
jgi:hypothetical protein